jgi:16S rRNA (guanine1207-N2)-methyltransferase
MISPRLDLALETGDVSWPDGPVLALRPEPGVSGLPRDRTQVAHGFRPAYDAWTAAGFAVSAQAEGPFTAAYVGIPRTRDHGRALVARAAELVSPGGLIVVDGAKTDGAESLLKACKTIFGLGGSLSKAHGKLFWFDRPSSVPPQLADWSRAADGPEGWQTAAGVFSADAVDRASALLAKHFPPLSGRVADLGAGWGYLAAQALVQSEKIVHLDLVEAEFAALEAARANIADPRAAFHWADVLHFSAEPYDVVVMNPPFHPSRKADPRLGQDFVRAAARLLKRDGTLALVANRHLPYETVLTDSFVDVATRADQDGFKVIHARKPRRKAGR